VAVQGGVQVAVAQDGLAVLAGSGGGPLVLAALGARLCEHARAIEALKAEF
jgi:hypothetical protein